MKFQSGEKEVKLQGPYKLQSSATFVHAVRIVVCLLISNCAVAQEIVSRDISILP